MIKRGEIARMTNAPQMNLFRVFVYNNRSKHIHKRLKEGEGGMFDVTWVIKSSLNLARDARARIAKVTYIGNQTNSPDIGLLHLFIFYFNFRVFVQKDFHHPLESGAA